MNINDPIMSAVRNQVESTFAKECTGCHAVDRWNIDKVTEGMNLISKSRTSPGKRNLDQRVFLVFMRCGCGRVRKTDVELSN